MPGESNPRLLPSRVSLHLDNQVSLDLKYFLVPQIIIPKKVQVKDMEIITVRVPLLPLHKITTMCKVRKIHIIHIPTRVIGERRENDTSENWRDSGLKPILEKGRRRRNARRD